MSIEDWRTQINALDTALLRLLNQRARIALRVGESKTAEGLSLCDHTREREVIERMCEANAGPLDDRAIVELFRAVIHESRRIQTRALDQSHEEPAAHELKLDRGHVRVAFQGAPGAFSEEAAVKLSVRRLPWCPVQLSNHSFRPSKTKARIRFWRPSRTVSPASFIPISVNCCIANY